MSRSLTRSRIRVISGAMVILLASLLVRLVYIQIIQRDKYKNLAMQQRMRKVDLPASRGGIYDRKGKSLAVNIAMDSVYASPNQMSDRSQVASKLAAVLDKSPDEILQLLDPKRGFVWIQRKASFDRAAAVKALNLGTVNLIKEYKRAYPGQELASNIIGFAGLDMQGLYGLEVHFDKYLRGVPGYMKVEEDAIGRNIPYGVRKIVPPADGQDIYLTIDSELQHIAERELKKAVKNARAAGGCAIAMDPWSGDVLAMASCPTYNPNNYGSYDCMAWSNRAVQQVYEPGSIFKLITAAAALEEKVYSPGDTVINCSGTLGIDRRTVHCVRHGNSSGHGSESVSDVIVNSCNVGAATLGLKLGSHSLYRYIREFGFGQVTGISLPGEERGLLQSSASWQRIKTANIAFGQGIGVTPIQMTRAVCVLANGGKLYRPRIVRNIRTRDGVISKEYKVEDLGRVISPETAAAMRRMMQRVVLEGTGKAAAIEGYSTGGKTGTAQKVGAYGYGGGRYIASFVGLAPVDHPRLVVLVSIDEPKGAYYGGVIAAPAFKEIVRSSLIKLGVPPDKGDAVIREDA